MLLLQKLSEKSAFDDVVQDVSGRCPSIHLPWLDIETALTDIRQNAEKGAQSDDSRSESANNKHSDKLHASAVEGSRQSTTTSDYSHLYIYKKNSPGLTTSQSQKTAEYIALSSSSSDEDEGDTLLDRVANFHSVDDVATDSSVTSAADSTPTTGSHRGKRSQLYQRPNTGVQIANPNKKRKCKKQS